MKVSSFLFYTYLVSIFSIFLPITIYPVFFLIFIFFNLLTIIQSKQHILSKRLFKFFVFILLFIFVASMSFILNISNSDQVQYTKILVNFIFLISIIYYLQNNIEIFIRKRKIFQFLFEIIIFFSFIQILINVNTINFWMMPFIGIENSVVAYRIVEPTIFFGTTEKNIWATKIAFIQIIYFSFIYFQYFKASKFKVSLIWIFSIFNILYTFSRTAQLVLLLFITLFLIWKIFYVYKNILLKFIAIISFLLVSIPTGIVIYDKLFHITLGSGDGLGARLELWLALYNNLDNMNLFIGNGILYAKYVISAFTSWTNNNFHNVFLNTFADEGVIGLLLYLFILKIIFFSTSNSKQIKRYISIVLFIPFLACINSHYLGYDNDVVIYFSLVFLFTKYLNLKAFKEQQHVHSINNNSNI